MSISRRKFLSWIGVAGITAITGRKIKAATVGSYKGHISSFSVLHDSVLCLGCRKCEEACNKVNMLPKPEYPFADLSVLDDIRRTTTNAYTVVNKYVTIDSDISVYYKNQCNHCLEPACASACFVGALKKNKNGPVVYDASVCVGCRYCMIACPFDVPTYEYEKAFSPRIMKCTMCDSRVEDGLIPGCVEVCPSGALAFGRRDELIIAAKSRILRNKEKYLNHVYGELEMGGTSWLYLAGTNFDNIGLRTDLGIIPAAKFTAPALGSVPLVVGLWPILLTGLYAINKHKEVEAFKKETMLIEKTINIERKEAKRQLSEAMSKAETDKAAAIQREVKKALEEAAKDGEPLKRLDSDR